jgi:uncharacterized integral membrane protein (TIGR00698 family)
MALSERTPQPGTVRKLSKPLLQTSVVLLGLSMDLGQMLRVGRDGFLVAALTIGAVLLAGHLLGRWLGVAPRVSALLSAGTAICGGSAIAAVGGAIAATQAEMAVAMGTVFLLNGIALYLFPVLGHALALNPDQFGAWAGIAIHDISSVVGAAASYSESSLDVATAVKLSRTLWILPIAAAFAAFWREPSSGDSPKSKPAFPWFIAGFLAASLAGTTLAFVHSLAPSATILAKAGMRLTLFLIGAGVCRKTLREVGWRPLAQGVILWLILSALSLVATWAL